ncbi:MAG: DUF362 domain-containing protein [Spirochaetales bacterium]|nr:DUF362 domain-containing protein [Spirochaetales bacterium]
MTNATVAIKRCEHYDPELILKLLNEMISETAFPDVKGKKVLLKPNILSGSAPEKAVTTHPEFVRAVIRFVKEKGASEIYVGDSPGVGSADAAGRKCGIREVVQAEGAHWALFDSETPVPCPEGRRQKQFYLASITKDVDMIISLPKMKTHEMMYFTGAVKNLFGLIPGMKKSRFHFNFPEKDDFAAMIADLLDTVKPVYAIMDGILAMEGPGPGSGYPRQTDLIFASANAAALDWAAASIMGYNPEDIPIFRQITDRGEWLSPDPSIDYPFLKPEDLVISDFKKVHIIKDNGFFKNAMPSFLYNGIKNMYVPRPVFKADPCIVCRKCVEICPADVLQVAGKAGSKGKKIEIDYKGCIRCYCCHEVCPVDAIAVKRRLF